MTRLMTLTTVSYPIYVIIRFHILKLKLLHRKTADSFKDNVEA